ncbi:MAG: ABC transporter substrate-binding protein, partial [Pseudomonadota bacterium]
MNILTKTVAAAMLSVSTLAMVPAAPALAETVLRLDEVAVGELDPGKASDYADSILMFNVYDTLVMPAQGAPGLVPHLAESWSADGNNHTFKLRQDVKFQSGNPLTAEDVVFSLERMQALGAGLSYLFANVDRAEAVDDQTVTFVLKEPYAPFVASMLRLPIVDKKLVMENLGDGDGEMKDWGQAFLSANGAGSGAYTVTSHNPQQETVMAKNADYFLGVPDAAPDTVRLRYGLEPATVRTLISQGEHDISSQWLPPEVLKALAQDGAQLLTESGTG